MRKLRPSRIHATEKEIEIETGNKRVSKSELLDSNNPVCQYLLYKWIIVFRILF